MAFINSITNEIDITLWGVIQSVKLKASQIIYYHNVLKIRKFHALLITKKQQYILKYYYYYTFRCQCM
jgi:hypothetical protein